MDGPCQSQGVAAIPNPSLMLNGIKINTTEIELDIKKAEDPSSSRNDVPNLTISPDEIITSILAKAQDPKAVKLSQCLQNLNAQMAQGIVQQQQPAAAPQAGLFQPNFSTSSSSNGIIESFVDLINTLASMSNEDEDPDDAAKKAEELAITITPEPEVPKIIKEIIDQKKLLAGDCMIKDNNNYIPTNKSIVVGERNTIIGHCNNISGDGNCVRGSLNTISGDRNKIYGNDNKVYGNWNRVFGLDNEVVGENNKSGVEEDKNNCIIN